MLLTFKLVDVVKYIVLHNVNELYTINEVLNEPNKNTVSHPIKKKSPFLFVLKGSRPW